ncbi:MAG: YceI family protein [Hydrogenophilaceae bacterium]|jgi:polyisoprenoid-binding protein YceI|nr:YceI family protein [Hydrogenophilaceae bacterium]
MRSILAAALLFALLPAPAAGQVPPALPPGENASLDPAQAPAGAYALDPRHASVIWRIRHQSLGLFVGRFDRMAGTLTFDPNAPENSRLDVQVEAASVSTNVYDDPAERRFDREIAASLGAADAPLIRFVAQRVTRTGPATGLIEGALTMNGRTHPATFEATFQGGRSVLIPRGGKYVLAFSARAIINRRDWDVGSSVFNAFTGDLVEIIVDAEFVQQ